MKINPKDLERAMKQLGVKSETVDATEVIIRSTNKELVITNPNVQKITMGDHESFQITGNVREKKREAYTEEDVKLVAEQAGVDEVTARRTLEKNGGDIAAAIMELQ